jgi:hypothetical protein
MAKKGDKKIDCREKVGIVFSVAELVGALSMAQCEHFAKDPENSKLDVIVIFEFIGCNKSKGIQGGVNCKESSFESFLIQQTCLKSKIEDAVLDWVGRKQFEELLRYCPEEEDDGYEDI